MRRLYRYWILDALARSGSGKLPLSQVFLHVEKNMGREFTHRELADVPSGAQITWQNDVQQVRRNMIESGFLTNRSDGTWEIADKGSDLLKGYGEPPKLGHDISEIG